MMRGASWALLVVAWSACSAADPAPKSPPITCPQAASEKLFYPGMRIATMQTPYLVHGVIQSGTGQTPSGPEFYYLGCTRGGAFPLGTTEAFNRLLASAGADLDSRAARELLVAQYVQITHNARLLDGFAALERELSLPRNRRGDLKPASRRELARLRAAYAVKMNPVGLEVPPPARVVVYGLRGDDLLRFEIDVAAVVTDTVEVVETGLPVPMRI